MLSLLFLCLYIFCSFQYRSSFVLSFLPLQLTSSLLCLHTFIVKKRACVFLSVSDILRTVPCSCTGSVLTSHHHCTLLCHAAVQAPFSPLTTTAPYCVFFTRAAEMVALREMCQFISLRLSYLALNTATIQVSCLTRMFKGILTCRQRNSVGFSTEF